MVTKIARHKTHPPRCQARRWMSLLGRGAHRGCGSDRLGSKRIALRRCGSPARRHLAPKQQRAPLVGPWLLLRHNDELTRGRQAPESLTIHGKYQVADTGTISGGVSNPVQSKAIRLLAMEHRAERALFYVQAIDSVLSTLTTVDKQLIKLKYFEGKLTNAGVASELGIGERQFYEWRNTIIRKFALRFGMA